MTPSNLVSLDGKIFLYKGEAKEYPKKHTHGERPYQPFYKPYGMGDDEYAHEKSLASKKEDEWAAECQAFDEEYEQAVAAFERDLVMCEDQEKAKLIIWAHLNPDERELNPKEIQDRTIYSVSVEIEIVEQFKAKIYGTALNKYDWADCPPTFTTAQMLETRTIARIKKEESKPF